MSDTTSYAIACTLSVTLNICVSVSSSHVCISSFVTGTCFLLSGTDGVGVGGFWGAMGVGRAGFG